MKDAYTDGICGCTAPKNSILHEAYLTYGHRVGCPNAWCLRELQKAEARLHSWRWITILRMVYVRLSQRKDQRQECLQEVSEMWRVNISGRVSLPRCDWASFKGEAKGRWGIVLGSADRIWGLCYWSQRRAWGSGQMRLQVKRWCRNPQRLEVILRVDEDESSEQPKTWQNPYRILLWSSETKSTIGYRESYPPLKGVGFNSTLLSPILEYVGGA